MLSARLLKLRRFVKTQARIVELGKQEVHSEGFTRKYNIIAKYEYEFGEKKYTGNVVNIMDIGKGQLLNFDNELFVELQSAQKNDEPIVIWVDPYNPGNAIITKKVYWSKLLLILLIALIGVIFLMIA